MALLIGDDQELAAGGRRPEVTIVAQLSMCIRRLQCSGQPPHRISACLNERRHSAVKALEEMKDFGLWDLEAFPAQARMDDAERLLERLKKYDEGSSGQTPVGAFTASVSFIQCVDSGLAPLENGHLFGMDGKNVELDRRVFGIWMDMRKHALLALGKLIGSVRRGEVLLILCDGWQRLARFHPGPSAATELVATISRHAQTATATLQIGRSDPLPLLRYAIDDALDAHRVPPGFQTPRTQQQTWDFLDDCVHAALAVHRGQRENPTAAKLALKRAFQAYGEARLCHGMLRQIPVELTILFAKAM